MKLQVLHRTGIFKEDFFSLVVSLTNDLPHGSESAGAVGFAGKALSP